MPTKIEQHQRSVEDVSSVSNLEVVDGVTHCQPSSSSDVIVMQREVENKSDRSAMTLRHDGTQCRQVRTNSESMVVSGNRDNSGAAYQRSSAYRNRTRCSSTCVDSSRCRQNCHRSTQCVVHDRGVSPSPQRSDQQFSHVIRSRRGRAASWSAPSTRTDACFRSSDHLDDGDVNHALVIEPETDQCDQTAENRNETSCRSRSLCRSVGVPCRINVGAVNVTTPTAPPHPQESVVSEAAESSTCVTDRCNRNNTRPISVDGCSFERPAERRRCSRYPRRCAALCASVRCMAVVVLAVVIVGVAAGVALCLNSPEQILGYVLFGLNAFPVLI